MRWPWTRSRSAASTSAPPAARSTRRRTRARPGRLSPGTCRPCCRWRCRRCHDQGRAARAPANASQVDGEVEIAIDGLVTQRAVLDALESRYPVLRGAIRDAGTGQRRAFVRFFACEQDLSHEAPDDPLPEEVAQGKEPYLIVGAMAGG